MSRNLASLALQLIALNLIWLPAVLIEAASRPNVLLIMTDDQGYGDLSLHGNPYLRTPRLDRLGLESVRFDRFYVNSFCAPTRAALLTGRYPLRCGVWGVTHGKETMRREEVTLAELLRGAGYRTGCFGKWHNGEQFPYTPTGQGFEEFVGFHNGHWNNYFDARLLRGSKFEPTSGYITDVITDEALRFIERHRDEPFLCYVPYNAPHSPYQVPDRYYDRYRKLGLDERVSAYYGMCENIDENVGRLLDGLEQWQLADNTMVLFLTDNGGTAGVKLFNAGMRGGKTSVHEGGCRVPLFVRWPKLFQPRITSTICSHIDVLPTLLDLCGVPQPTDVRLDGRSLRPLLEGREEGWPERVLFTHNPISETNRYPGAARTPRFRLVREIRGSQGGSSAKAADDSAQPWQLYDMQADPGEKQNIAAEHPELVTDLSRQYEAWLDEITRDGLRRFPIPVGHEEENPVTVHAPQTYFDGEVRFSGGPGYAHDWLTNWINQKDSIWIELDVVRPGRYEIELAFACPASDAGSRLQVEVRNEKTGAHQSLEANVPVAEAPLRDLPHRDEAGRARYRNRDWGHLKLGSAQLDRGPYRVTLRALTKIGDSVLDFKHLQLHRMSD